MFEICCMAFADMQWSFTQVSESWPMGILFVFPSKKYSSDGLEIKNVFEGRGGVGKWEVKPWSWLT